MRAVKISQPHVFIEQLNSTQFHAEMTDYKEEQANELEAIESIYTDELTILGTEPYPTFQITVKPQSEDEVARCVLQFTYTATYPDDLPEMSIEESEGLDDSMEAQLLSFIQEQAEESKGMVMVFTIVSAAQEKMTQLLEEEAERKEMEAERRLKEEEEAERKKFEGTRVSVETFLAWKAKFDAEIAEAKRQKGQKVKDGPKKLTGKELFMQDHTLDDSDVKFLEEDGDSVQVDESLFQDMDDLDLDEDELS